MVISADIPVIAFASILQTADELLKCFDYWRARRTLRNGLFLALIRFEVQNLGTVVGGLVGQLELVFSMGC